MMDANLASRPSLTIVRRIAAPPARVFAHWTDASLMARWFCADDTILREVEVDPRLGGRFHIVMQEGEDGEIHDVSGNFKAFEPDRRLVFSWAWITMPERESEVTIELRAIDGGTEMTFTHAQFADERARDAHQQGWTQILTRLVQAVEGE